jgi:hypothetical protein
MKISERSLAHARPRGRLRLFKIPQGSKAAPPVARWLINGFPATVIIWTEEQWAELDEHPEDAQALPNGIWCVLRME